MKVVLIIVLAFSLLLSNAVMATNDKKQPNADALEKAKANILQSVSIRLEVLNKFKSCVAVVKTGAELESCKQQRNDAFRALREKVKQAGAKRSGMKKVVKLPKQVK